MVEVRRIRPGERAAALDTIVAAFRRDPQLRWWFPGDDEYDAAAPAFFGVLLDTRIEGGEVWVADDTRAVAMWVPPGGNLIGPELASARYSTMVASLSPAAAERIQRTDEAVDHLLPSGAHWYLGVLACHPAHHRGGLGWAVAAPVLAAADRARLPVALETSSQVNVGYYTRRGFALIGEVPLPDAARPAGSPAPELAGGSGPQVPVTPVTPVTPVMRVTPVTPGQAAPARCSSSAGITVYVMRREPRA